MGGIPDRILKSGSPMRPLTVIAIEGWGICAFLCLVTLFGTRTQPTPAFIQGFSLCEAKPCYLNMIPGTTGWDDAQAILSDYPEIVFNPETSSASNLPGFQGWLLLIPNQDRVTHEMIVSKLDLSPFDSTTNVGGAILQLGAPCAAVRLGRDDLGLIYPGISIITRLYPIENHFALRPTSPVIKASLYRRVRSCSDIDLGATQANFHWQGFIRYYENSAAGG